MNNVTLQPLPHGWEWTKIENLYYVVGGGTPSTKKEDYWKGDIPWISSADIYGVIDIRPRKKITQEAIDNSATNLVPAGSIVVVTRVGLGKVAKTTYPLCFSQDSQGLIAKKNSINIDYALYYLSTAVQSFKYQSRGTTISGVTKKQLKNVPFPLAPLPEQQRIVAKIEELFTQLDAAEAALKRAKANLKRYRQSVLQAAVSGELTREWRAAHAGQLEPAAVLLERIRAERKAKWAAELRARGKDPLKEKYVEPQGPDVSKLPEMPEGWVWENIGSVLEVTIGGTPKRNIPQYWNGSIPWVSSGEVDYQRIQNTRESITKAGFENSNAKLLPKGTILLGMIGEGKTRGQVAILDIEACTNQNIASIICSITPIVPEWIYYWLMSQYKSIRKNGSGGMQYALNCERVKNLIFVLPSIAEQREIIGIIECQISVIDEMEKNIISKLKKIESLRQSILQRAFSGQLVE